jgi:hypothetical protein
MRHLFWQLDCSAFFPWCSSEGRGSHQIIEDLAQEKLQKLNQDFLLSQLHSAPSENKTGLRPRLGKYIPVFHLAYLYYESVRESFIAII